MKDQVWGNRVLRGRVGVNLEDYGEMGIFNGVSSWRKFKYE